VTITVPGWLVYIIGGVVAVVGLLLSALLLRGRRPMPVPTALAPLVDEAWLSTAIDARATSAQTVIDAAAAGRAPRDNVAELLNNRADEKRSQ